MWLLCYSEKGLSLKLRAYSAVRWTAMASVVRASLQLAQVAVLARLLSPEDFGLIAIVGLVLGFSAMFADMGINAAYVQRQDVTFEERSSLFWLNLGLSVVITMLIFILSPVIASFFSDDRLIPLIMLAVVTFVANALGQQVRMTAEKALEFRPVILIEIIASISGFVVAISTAKSGFGVYSLIWGSIVTASIGTLLTWFFLAHGWRPMWRFKISDVRSYLGFGSALVANNIVNEVNRNIDLIFGGRMLAAAALGFYSLPRQLVFQVQNAVNPIITRVGFPLIAQVQDDIPKVRLIYLKTLNMTASINAPLYLGIAFFSPEITRLLLGDKWIDAADLLRLFVIWGFFRSIGNPVGSLLLGMGRADLSLKWNLVMLCIVPPVLWVSSYFGSLGLAWGLLSLAVLLFFPGWYVLVRPLCDAKFLEYSMASLRPFFISLISIYPAFFLMSGFENSFIKLSLGMILSMPIYFIFSYFFNRDWVISLVELIIPSQSYG